ncbi:MAG: hypothetical protein NTW44_00975 [Nitrospirae bacterium]|nr:hypothetical protein [Nitrospirota bacterium]
MKIQRGMAVVIIFMVLLLVSACTKNEPMPLTEKNILSYVDKVEKAAKSLKERTKKEPIQARVDEKKVAEDFRKTFVKSMEDMGYNYDKTIRIAAIKYIEKDYSRLEDQYNLVALLLFPVQVKDLLVRSNIISQETKVVLDKVHL